MHKLPFCCGGMDGHIWVTCVLSKFDEGLDTVWVLGHLSPVGGSIVCPLNTLCVFVEIYYHLVWEMCFSQLWDQFRLHTLFRAATWLLLQMQQRRHHIWVHLTNRKREENGAFHNLLQELNLHRPAFFNYFCMSVSQMETRLSFVREDLIKQTTTFRELIEPKQLPAVALTK